MNSDEFKDSLDRLCLNLLSILNETENLLNIEKQRYEQVKSVHNPWPVKKRKSIETISTDILCTCSKPDISTQPSTSSNLDPTIINSIPKIVSKTKALRINPSKGSIKFSDAKKTIKDVISNSKLSKSGSVSFQSSKPNRMKTNKNTSSITTSQSKSVLSDFPGQTIHSPSCKLYNLGATSKVSVKSSTHSNLSEAVSAYGVPSTLQKILEDYYSFVFERNKINDITKKARSSFMKSLNRQNEETWMEASNQIEKLPQYISVVCSIQEKIKKEHELPCVIYRKINELVQYENKKFEIQEKEMWFKIIEYIHEKMIPVLLNCDLSTKEKIYTSKMLKTVCNFSKSRVPNVPVYILD